MKNLERILWGIVLIVIGFIIGGNVLGIINVNLFFRGWWTLFIIVPCFIGLFNNNDRTGDLIGLLVGIVLLLACQRIINFLIIWKLILPVTLIVIGGYLIFKDIFNKKISDEIKKISENTTKEAEYTSVFSGDNIRFDGQVFNGTDLKAIFGGIECDLRNAIINSDVLINATCVFGGIDIFVPDNVKVKVKSTSLFGGVSNKKKQEKNEDMPTIYVNGSSFFGGIQIK